jgi:hypothetical protein
LVRKYWRLAADVMETRRPVAAQDVVQRWRVLHQDYVYTVDNYGDFLLKLPTSEIARDLDTQELIQQVTDEGLSYQKSWVVLLHG